MTTIALAALYQAVRHALINANGEFGDRVYLAIAPAGAAYPYVVYNWTGGGDDNARAVKKTANILLQVKCVDEDSLAAMAGAARIDATLDDAGEQDQQPRLDASYHGWVITTSQAEGDVALVDQFAAVVPQYHFGKVFRFIMEEI